MITAEELELHAKYLRGEADGVRLNKAGADLAGANLTGADLAGLLAKQTIVPEDGEFTAFKNVRRSNNERAILTLKIPAEAARLGGLVGRKCRASRALVVRAETKDGATIENETFFSDHNKKFSYEVGKTIEPDGFNDNPTIECSNGIHFFITRREAIEYA